MRVVLDTNVVIAGLLWRGKPYELLGQVIDGNMQCFASAPLIEELERVLGYDKLAKRSASLNTTAEMIVSDDAHLLNLKQYQGIPVVTVAEGFDTALLSHRIRALRRSDPWLN